MVAPTRVQQLEPPAITPLLDIAAITPPQSTAVIIQLQLKTVRLQLLLLQPAKRSLAAANYL